MGLGLYAVRWGLAMPEPHVEIESIWISPVPDGSPYDKRGWVGAKCEVNGKQYAVLYAYDGKDVPDKPKEIEVQKARVRAQLLADLRKAGIV